MTTIYVLLDPRTNGIRYVGRTIDPPGRLRAHIQTPVSAAMAAWIGALAEENLAPTMDVLETCEDIDADRVETKWIRELALAGTLLNLAKMTVRRVRPPVEAIPEGPQEDDCEEPDPSQTAYEGPTTASTAFLLSEATGIVAALRLPAWAHGIAIRWPIPSPWPKLLESRAKRQAEWERFNIP